MAERKEELIINCKDIKDYLKLCNVDTIDKLTDNQLITWAASGKMGIMSKFSIKNVINGVFGKKPDYQKAISMLRQAIRENKEFICSFVDYESFDGPYKSDGDEFENFEMFLIDKKE